MTREGLRKILQDIDEDLFEFLWRLFDVDDVGTVDADNFVMAMGLLTQQVTTVDDQIEAAFYMFDVEKAGVLTPSKFEEMIKATVNLSLGQLLNTETGMNEFEAVLQKEYSEENLDFWKRTRAYASLDAGAARLAEAESLVTEFVTENRCDRSTCRQRSRRRWRPISTRPRARVTHPPVSLTTRVRRSSG